MEIGAPPRRHRAMGEYEDRIEDLSRRVASAKEYL
jgi:hypothetical protein